VIRFIDAHKDQRSGQLRWGIEPIAKVLGIAPSTYHAAKTRPPSPRAIRDAELRPEILRVWEQNLSVYGADKIWDQLNKDGVEVARCTVERLMRDMGLQGCRRGRIWIRTTEGDDRLDRPADLVERRFRAPEPNRLWVADLTYVKTHAGWVYVAFIVDVFSRMVVGWQASRSLRSDLAIDALEMAVHNRRRAGANLDQLIHHSDRGVQGELNWSSQHLDRGGVRWRRCGSGRSRCSCIEGRSPRPAPRQSHGVRTGWRSGLPSPRARRPTTRPWLRVCHPRLGIGGSVTLAA
jgi:transposase InsO family protein